MVPPSGMVTAEQLVSADHEVFLLRVPAHLSAAALQDAVISLRSPELVELEGGLYEPVVQREVGCRAVVLPGHSVWASKGSLLLGSLPLLRNTTALLC